MKIDIYYDFKEIVDSIKEEMQIIKHKAILNRMKVMLRLMKRKKKELDDLRSASSTKRVA